MHDVAVNCVRSKDAQKQLARTSLSTSSISVCKESVVTFTCTADANPPVHTYRLYKNGSMIANMSGSGVWIRTLDTSGQFNYSCDASNSLGTGTSNDSTMTEH